jgi:hypothetical protein
MIAIHQVGELLRRLRKNRETFRDRGVRQILIESDKGDSRLLVCRNQRAGELNGISGSKSVLRRKPLRVRECGGIFVDNCLTRVQNRIVPL